MTKHKCATCGEFFQSRNFIRHRKACLRRKRDARKKAALAGNPLFEQMHGLGA